MNLRISWLEASRFAIKTGDGFDISADAEGTSAPCPTEILLSAMGSCFATDVVSGLQDQGLELKKLLVTVGYSLTEAFPQLYETVNLHMEVEAESVTEAHINAAAQDAIDKYSHVCLMVQPKVKITYSFEILHGTEK